MTGNHRSWDALPCQHACTCCACEPQRGALALTNASARNDRLFEGAHALLRHCAGGRICENLGANARVFGGAAASPRDILAGSVRPPHEFKARCPDPQRTALWFSKKAPSSHVHAGHHLPQSAMHVPPASAQPESAAVRFLLRQVQGSPVEFVRFCLRQADWHCGEAREL